MSKRSKGTRGKQRTPGTHKAQWEIMQREAALCRLLRGPTRYEINRQRQLEHQARKQMEAMETTKAYMLREISQCALLGNGWVDGRGKAADEVTVRMVRQFVEQFGDDFPDTAVVTMDLEGRIYIICGSVELQFDGYQCRASYATTRHMTDDVERLQMAHIFQRLTEL